MKIKLDQAWAKANGDVSAFYNDAVKLAQENSHPTQRRELVTAMQELANRQENVHDFYLDMVGESMKKYVANQGEKNGKDFLAHDDRNNPLGQVLTTSLNSFLEQDIKARQEFFQTAFEGISRSGKSSSNGIRLKAVIDARDTFEALNSGTIKRDHNLMLRSVSNREEANMNSKFEELNKTFETLSDRHDELAKHPANSKLAEAAKEQIRDLDRLLLEQRKELLGQLQKNQLVTKEAALLEVFSGQDKVLKSKGEEKLQNKQKLAAAMTEYKDQKSYNVEDAVKKYNLETRSVEDQVLTDQQIRAMQGDAIVAAIASKPTTQMSKEEFRDYKVKHLNLVGKQLESINEKLPNAPLKSTNVIRGKDQLNVEKEVLEKLQKKLEKDVKGLEKRIAFEAQVRAAPAKFASAVSSAASNLASKAKGAFEKGKQQTTKYSSLRIDTGVSEAADLTIISEKANKKFEPLNRKIEKSVDDLGLGRKDKAPGHQRTQSVGGFSNSVFDRAQIKSTSTTRSASPVDSTSDRKDSRSNSDTPPPVPPFPGKLNNIAPTIPPRPVFNKDAQSVLGKAPVSNIPAPPLPARPSVNPTVTKPESPMAPPLLSSFAPKKQNAGDKFLEKIATKPTTSTTVAPRSGSVSSSFQSAKDTLAKTLGGGKGSTSPKHIAEQHKKGQEKGHGLDK